MGSVRGRTGGGKDAASQWMDLPAPETGFRQADGNIGGSESASAVGGENVWAFELSQKDLRSSGCWRCCSVYEGIVAKFAVTCALHMEVPGGIEKGGALRGTRGGQGRAPSWPWSVRGASLSIRPTLYPGSDPGNSKISCTAPIQV